MRGAVPHNTGRNDLRAAKRRMNDVDETNVLVRIPRADLRPRQWLGFEGRDLLGSIHASSFAGRRSLSSFLTCNTSSVENPSVDDSLGSLLPPVTAWWFDAEQFACGIDRERVARDDRRPREAQ